MALGMNDRNGTKGIVGVLAAVAVACMPVTSLGELIDLDLRLPAGAPATYNVGDDVLVELWFEWDGDGTAPKWTGADVFFAWDAALDFTGWQDAVPDPGPDAWPIDNSGVLPTDPVDPQQRLWWGTTGNHGDVESVAAPGMHITTLEFEAVSAADWAVVEIIEGDAWGDTSIRLGSSWDNLAGSLGDMGVIVVPEPAAGALALAGLVCLGFRVMRRRERQA